MTKFNEVQVITLLGSGRLNHIWAFWAAVLRVADPGECIFCSDPDPTVKNRFKIRQNNLA